MKLKYPFFKHLAPTYYARTRNVLELIPKKGMILDLGCGDGAYAREIIGANSVIGSDINFFDLFKDESFDNVLCIELIEHVNNDLNVFNELSRVLKKEGILVISTPNANFPFFYDPINFILKFFNKHLSIGIWGFGHVRVYDFDKFKELLEMHNFKIVEARLLTYGFMGLFENYGSDIIRALTGKKKPKRSRFVRFMLPFLSLGYKIDKRWFSGKRSVGMMVLAKKC